MIKILFIDILLDQQRYLGEVCEHCEGQGWNRVQPVEHFDGTSPLRRSPLFSNHPGKIESEIKPIYFGLPVATTNRLAYLCCQCDASLDGKLARLVVARGER